MMQELSEGTKPAIIQVSKELTTPYYTERENRLSELYALAYSDDYTIIKDEYIVNNDVILHHVIAKRKE
jgi:hypothetical protein